MAIYGNMVVPSRPGGGALPTSSDQPAPYVPGSTVTQRFSDAGAQIAGQAAQQSAKGLGDVARGVGRLGPMFGALAERADRLDMAKAQEAVSRLQIEGIEERTRLSRLKGAAAVGADGKALDVEEQWRNWYVQARAKHAEGLGARGRRYFELHADTYNVQQQAWAAQYQEQQLGHFQDQQLKLALDTEGNQISLAPFNDQATAQSLGRIRALIEQEGLRKGWTPEMVEQAFRQAAGTAWGNAMAVQISQGNLEGANRLMAQYGAWLPADQRAKLTVSWNDSLRMQAAGLAQAGDVEGIRRLMQGAGARTLDQALEVGASATVGQKYTWGQNDCSGHTCQIWQAALADSPAKRAIFGADGEHRTAAEIMQRASEVTGHLYKGLEINESSVGGGWLLASAGQAHASGRFHNIGHIVTTFRKGDGSVWVSEALGGKTGQVQTMPLAQFLARYKGRALYGVNLSSMLASQGGGAPGAPGGGYSAGGRKVYDISAPIAGAIESEAARQGVDPAQALVICQIESSGNMNDKTGQYHGLYQLSEEDTREFGQPGDNRHDQATNIRVGIAQWKRCLQEFKDPHIACVAYNRGIGATKKWVREGADVSKLPVETQNYLKKYDRYMAGLPKGAGKAQAGQAPGMAMGQGFQMLPQTHQAIQTLELPAQANLLYQQALAGGGTPEEQQLRFMESLKPLPQGVQDKLRPYGERWFADMKQDRDTQGQIQYQQAWELLSKNKTRREQENLYTQLMQSDRLNDVAKSKLKSRWNEEKQVEKPEGAKWCTEMYGKIDEYWKDNAQPSADIDRAIDAAAGSGAITDKQAQDLRAWNRSGGARKALVGDTDYLKQAYNELLDPRVKKAKWKDVPPELLQRLWQKIKSNGDKAVTEKEIKAMLAEEMSVAHVQTPSFMSRILPVAGLVFPGMMTSTKEARYWQAQTSGKGEKLVGLVPLPHEYAKVRAEAAEHGYDPNDPEAVARYNLVRLNSQNSHRRK